MIKLGIGQFLAQSGSLIVGDFTQQGGEYITKIGPTTVGADWWKAFIFIDNDLRPSDVRVYEHHIYSSKFHEYLRHLEWEAEKRHVEDFSKTEHNLTYSRWWKKFSYKDPIEWKKVKNEAETRSCCGFIDAETFRTSETQYWKDKPKFFDLRSVDIMGECGKRYSISLAGYGNTSFDLYTYTMPDTLPKHEHPNFWESPSTEKLGKEWSMKNKIVAAKLVFIRK